MKFIRENVGAVTIQSVTDQAIVVGDAVHSRPIVVSAGDEVSDWNAGPVAELTTTHFDELLEGAPEMVILGTGATNVFPPKELVFALARQGVGLESMDTRAAARTWNVLAAEGRRVAAVLYPPG